MFILPDDRRPDVDHPPWCDASRCNVGRGYIRHDGHRSAPFDLGRVAVTLVEQTGTSNVTLVVRARHTLKAQDADKWRPMTWAAAVAVDRALREFPSLVNTWQDDLGARDESGAFRMSTSTPGGDRSW